MNKYFPNKRPSKKITKSIAEKFWYVPSDVLQRSVEGSIWNNIEFKKPVLSIGIGNGEIDSIIYKGNPAMEVGIDIDPSQLSHASSLGIYKKVLEADATDMPFKSTSFNTVVSNSTFEHIKNDEKAVSEAARVLKRNGTLYFTTPSNFLVDWITEYEKNDDVKSKLLKFNNRTAHLHYRSQREWELLLNKYGLEIIYHKFYFPKKTVILWYRLFNLFTKKIRGREFWSYIGNSHLTALIPQQIVLKFYSSTYFFNKINNSYLNGDIGGQHFFIVKKSQ